MFRSLSFSVALAAACALTSPSQAQVASAETNESQTAQVELASYGQNYSSAAVGYPQTPQAMAYGQPWGGTAANRDCSRFYHYPYVFYPQNYRGSEYYRSSDSLYHRYPAEMQIPVYNRHWQNYYPSARRYHWGHHFILDVF
jgi:hypothetical protein